MVTETHKLIVVIGMHRTGTSLITRGLQVMGVNLGNNLSQAMADVNAKGFWEDVDINAFNIEMLHAIDSEWDFLMPITEVNIQDLQQQGFFLRAVELLRKKVAQTRIFGLKDPRIAKLLPFWDQVFAHCNYDVSYLLTIRHPLSVVKSLQKRDGFVAEKAYLLWFTHVVTALTFANKRNLSLVDYDFFMQNPADELHRLAQEFNLPINNNELSVFLNDFIDNNLRHTHYELNDLQLDEACPNLVRDIYSELLLITRDKNLLHVSAFEQRLHDWYSSLMFAKTPFTIIDDLYVIKSESEQTIQLCEQDIHQKQLFIKNLEQFNRERAEQVEGLYRDLEQLNQDRSKQVAELHHNLEQLNQDRSKQVAELHRDLQQLNQDRSRQVEELHRDLQQLNQDRSKQVAELHRDLQQLNQDRSKQVAELHRDLEQLNYDRAEQVAGLRHDLEQLDQARSAQIEKLYEGTLERDLHIQSLNEQITAAEHTITDLTKNLQSSYDHSYFLNKHIQLITNSSSWKITRPLRFMGRIVRYGLSIEDKSKLLLCARSLNQKLPGSIQQLNRALLGKWLRSMVNAPVQIITAESQISSTPILHEVQAPVVPASSSGKDFIIWGVIDWHFRHQRPQQIAQALAAEGDRVFYISSNLIEAKSAGFSIEPLDKEGRLFQIHLCVVTPTIIYHHAPSVNVVQQLLASVGELLLWAKTVKIINIIQHPFWYPIAQQLPYSQLVYDCMDHHEGFENTGKEVIALEHQLFSAADLTVTTSGFLDDIVAKYTPRREIIRNAGEYEYFSKVPAKIYNDPQGRKIIGYYGAIAEWFDIELIRLLSQRFSDCLILLVGADTVNAKSQLQLQQNIVFTGEVAYQELTQYLYAFDVCLLPFRVIPLILATNPVKIYEYLGAGKPVVAVDVPEIKQFGDLVLVGKDHAHFADQVDVALNEPENNSAIAERKQFAEHQTWHDRARDLSRALDNLQVPPKVSIIVVTYNNLDLTKQCLMSLDKYTDYSNIEIIVVDNASSDDSPAYLRDWEQQGNNRILILNPDNKGFAAGNNQGLMVATGDYLVLLNNDTHVTPGWVTSLVKHMQRDEKIGLLGPVTGNIGNEAKIAIQYADMDEMLIESSKFTLRHIGQLTPLRTAAFFCVMISRTAYEKVGLLDEAFGIGFFEDDDYCRRIEQAGFTIYCADDVFIHHHLSASFNKLKVEARQKLFEQNKVTYEKKWGPWIPHIYRPGVN